MPAGSGKGLPCEIMGSASIPLQDLAFTLCHGRAS